jgi:hypothetical protein
MSVSDSPEITAFAGRKYVRHYVPTPAGQLEVEVRASHSHLEASVYLEVDHDGETIHQDRIVDGFEPVEQ